MKVWLKIVLAIIAVSPGIFGAVGYFINPAEEKASSAEKKADQSYDHLKRQVEFTDKELTILREDIKEVRDMVFNLTINISKMHSERESRNEERRSRRSANSSGRGAEIASVSDTIDKVEIKLEDIQKSAKKPAMKQMVQRPVLPEKL